MSSAIEVLKDIRHELEKSAKYDDEENKEKYFKPRLDALGVAVVALEQKDEAIDWIDAIIFNIQDLRYEGDDELIIKDLKKVKKVLGGKP